MNVIRSLRQRAGLTQADLAAAGGTSQPTIAAYESGRKSPTLGTVRRLAEAAGLEMAVEFHRPMTREERRSLHLHRAVARRLEAEPEETLVQARKVLDLMRRRHPHAEPLLGEWDVLLNRPLPDLLDLLVDQSPRARELRHVSPFAGVLSAVERTDAYLTFRELESARDPG
jgi:transcriptional regulator with XRE-family HTH domain